MTQQPSKWTRPSPTIRVGVLGLLAAFLLVLPLALAHRAEAFIYWTAEHLAGEPPRSVGSKIMRANLDGTGVGESFIRPGIARLGSVAVDEDHIYWMARVAGAETIGRANLDGTGMDPTFIPPPIGGGDIPGGIAVDRSHIYWASNTCGGLFQCVGSIGRADLDGTGVETGFITGFEGAVTDVAVDANHVYWAQDRAYPRPGSTQIAAIGRANLDGTGVDRSFIPVRYWTGIPPRGVAVDAAHIYWLNPPGTLPPAVARANLDGTGVDESFIDDFDLHANWPFELAVDAEHIYWADRYQGSELNGTIGRADLDGTNADLDFIPVPGRSLGGVAVDGLTDTKLAGTASAAKTQRQSGKRIVVRAKVKAKEQLTAKASGEVKVNPTYKLKPKTIKLATPETKKLRLKPKKAKAKKIAAALNRGEKAKAKVTVKLTDRAGNSETERLRVRLKR